MSKILKFYEDKQAVTTFDFDFEKFDLVNVIHRKNHPKNDEEAEDSSEYIEEEPVEAPPMDEERYAIIEKAKAEAEEIRQGALKEAETIKSEAYEEAYKKGEEEGYQEGYKKSYSDNNEKLNEDGKIFLKELSDIIAQAGVKKDQILMKYTDDLKNISIAVAEKVVQVSLKSSGEIIKNMILSATEKLKTKEWAKIYIARCDAEQLINGDIDIINAISKLSDHIKIIATENARHGTCIIELPDEIIDASASTQLENIKGILSGSSTYGGK